MLMQVFASSRGPQRMSAAPKVTLAVSGYEVAQAFRGGESSKAVSTLAGHLKAERGEKTKASLIPRRAGGRDWGVGISWMSESHNQQARTSAASIDRKTGRLRLSRARQAGRGADQNVLFTWLRCVCESSAARTSRTTGHGGGSGSGSPQRLRWTLTTLACASPRRLQPARAPRRPRAGATGRALGRAPFRPRLGAATPEAAAPRSGRDAVGGFFRA
jgi:hypothetical protein